MRWRQSNDRGDMSKTRKKTPQPIRVPRQGRAHVRYAMLVVGALLGVMAVTTYRWYRMQMEWQACMGNKYLGKLWKEKEPYRPWWRSPGNDEEKPADVEATHGAGLSRKKHHSYSGVPSYKELREGHKDEKVAHCVESCEGVMARNGYQRRPDVEKQRRSISKNSDYKFGTLSPALARSGTAGSVSDATMVLMMGIVCVWAGKLISNVKSGLKYVCVLSLVTIMMAPVAKSLNPLPLQGSSRQGNGAQITSYNAILAGLISTIVILSLLCIYLGRKWKGAMRHKKPDGIYLQMMTEKLSETIHLGECAMPLDQIFQGGKFEPLLLNVKIDFICGTAVAELRWGRLLYAIENIAEAKAKQMVLPQSINISRDMARELKNDHATHMARLVRCNGGLAAVVPVGMPMIAACGWTTIGGVPITEHEIEALKPNRQSQPKAVKVRGSRGVRQTRRAQYREQENREYTLTRVEEESEDLSETADYENTGDREYQDLREVVNLSAV